MKKDKLDAIAEEIKKCRKCKAGKSGHPVPGEGNPDAEIMFIGEAPGKQESLTGRPFVGRSGKLLRSLIKETGLQEEDVYITSPVKYLPDRGTPTADDIVHGRMHLFKQLDVIGPKILVLLGEKIAVTTEHGKIVEQDGRKCLITLHPASALRFPKIRKSFIEDFGVLKRLVKELWNAEQ
jgi:uracil-DNA glycosylase family 4